MHHALTYALAVGALPISMIRASFRTSLATTTGLTQFIGASAESAAAALVTSSIFMTILATGDASFHGAASLTGTISCGSAIVYVISIVD